MLSFIQTTLFWVDYHGIPFVIKTIRITSKVRLHCNETRSFRSITILITNQTVPDQIGTLSQVGTKKISKGGWTI